MHRLAVYGPEREPFLLAAVDDPQPVDDQRAAVRNRHSLSDSRGSQVLALLEQAVELFGFIAHLQEIDHLPQDILLRLRLQVEIDLLRREELDELHGIGIPGIWRFIESDAASYRSRRNLTTKRGPLPSSSRSVMRCATKSSTNESRFTPDMPEPTLACHSS